MAEIRRINTWDIQSVSHFSHYTQLSQFLNLQNKTRYKNGIITYKFNYTGGEREIQRIKYTRYLICILLQLLDTTLSVS